MICIIALIVFSILAIFSARYRPIAAEAFDCVFRRVTLRKCTSGLDKRLKSQITGKLMKKSPKTGRFIYKHFEFISWIFTIILILSIVQSGISVYNFIAYGNCNGKESDEFCIFDPLGSRNENPILGTEGSSEPIQCTVEGLTADPDLLLPPPIGESASFGNKDSKVKIIEFGCYLCDFTRESEEVYNDIRIDYAEKIEFVYKNFPLPTHPTSYNASLIAECVRMIDEEAYWDYHEMLFETEIFTNENYISLASTLVDEELVKECFVNDASKEIVETHISEGEVSGIYGTPTVFIGDEVLVGPKTYNEVKKLIEKMVD